MYNYKKEKELMVKFKEQFSGQIKNEGTQDKDIEISYCDVNAGWEAVVYNDQGKNYFAWSGTEWVWTAQKDW